MFVGNQDYIAEKTQVVKKKQARAPGEEDLTENSAQPGIQEMACHK
jgi:hypothetical protein